MEAIYSKSETRRRIALFSTSVSGLNISGYKYKKNIQYKP